MFTVAPTAPEIPSGIPVDTSIPPSDKASAGLHVERFNLLNVSVQVRASLIMNSEAVSARFLKCLRIPLRFEDHEMDITVFLCSLPKKLNNHWPE